MIDHLLTRHLPETYGKDGAASQGSDRIPDRSEVKEQYKWDLEALYSDTE